MATTTAPQLPFRWRPSKIVAQRRKRTLATNKAAANILTPSIPQSNFDLTELPVKAGIEAWQEGLGSMYNIQLHNQPERPIHIRSRASHFDSFIFGSLEVRVRQQVGRARAQAARDGLDSYTLHFHGRACGVSRDNGPYQRIEPGDLLILDQTQTSSSRLNGQDDLFLVVPRPVLAPLLSAPDEHNAHVISGKDPLVSLFRSHLYELYRATPELSPEAARAVIRPTLELAAAAINGSASEGQSTTLQSALTARICRYIEEHAMEPDLAAARIAAAFGMSQRKLYYLMGAYGGVAAYIQEVRLRRAKAAIVAPALRHMSIAEIAADFGFSDPTNFSRVFRRAFGMSPREMRAFAAEGRQDELTGRRNARSMWDWMRHLR
ncbi:helix-turn-helix domain-containing protein [Phreatobacter stygius]|uniref:Helix-turn-helix domain-containing protein n=1 Tax=Phreatobacter stygius TaxID=1940610 RepID=A0A4D7AUR6_9HYPH|nr:helix-turn-helix domain-containing protein [Phreatobacter stygius]